MSQLFLWTNPGKPVWDLIKYDSHKNADIASFLLGDNKGGRGAQEHSGKIPSVIVVLQGHCQLPVQYGQ